MRQLVALILLLAIDFETGGVTRLIVFAELFVVFLGAHPIVSCFALCSPYKPTVG